MGDRIAILREGSRIAQYDSPEHILSDPAGDFVEQFLGAGIVLKRLNLSRIKDFDVATADWPTIGADADVADARRALHDAERGHLLVIDERRRPQRWVSARELQHREDLEDAGMPVEATVDDHATLNDALQEMIVSAHGIAVVVDRDGGYVGTLDLDTITAAIRAMRAEAHERDAREARAGEEMT